MKIKPLIIAEAGLIHDGSIGIAKSFIDKAAETGVDAVKFQMHYGDHESSRYEKFRKKFSYLDKTRKDYWNRTSFNFDQWKYLKKEAEKKKLIFICSPFSLKAVDYLNNLKVKYWKIASGEFNNMLMIDKIVSKSNSPLILSTGLATKYEIDKVTKYLKFKRKKFSLLYCVSSYPTSLEKIDFKKISEYKKMYKIPVGISDHSGNKNVLLTGISLGAEFLEAHVTFSKNFFGPDNSSSITFEELKEVVNFRNIFYELVNNKPKKQKDLSKMRNLFCQSLKLNKNKKKGEKIYINDLDIAKPFIGIPSFDYKKIIGRKLKANKLKNSFIFKKDLY